MIIHKFVPSSAVQCDQHPDGFIAQSEDHCTGIAEACSGLNFRLLLIAQLLSVCNCDEQSDIRSLQVFAVHRVTNSKKIVV